METIEHLIVGAGPAGLRAGQVLADAGREVLVVERRADIGPKTCAGGLTRKTISLLRALGLPPHAGLENPGHVAFRSDRLRALGEADTAVVTLPRRDLGRMQLGWTRRAGADVWSGVAVTELDLPRRRARIGDRVVRWRHLVGADGSGSSVRRALGLPSPRAYFAAEYNVPGLRLGPLRVECVPGTLANGYFWVFPHCDYTSIGAVAPKHLVRPSSLRRFLDSRMVELGISTGGVPFEGAALEVHYQGIHFPGGVHLVGDAAGTPSSLTAEGIYPALVTGEEGALGILDRAYPAARTARWLRVKRRHDRLARLLESAGARAPLLGTLDTLARLPVARRALARWFLAG